MKKFYYIAMLLSLAATNVAAEEFLPILEPGKEWVYEMEYDYMHDDYVSVKATVLDHTVTIDGVKCSEIEFSPINEEDYPTYSLYCREENGEFSYFYDLTYFEKPGQFIPDVDFNVKEGDRIPMWDCRSVPFKIDSDSWLTVDKVELIEVKGIKRRRISFVNEKGCWVEGIGPSRPLMNRWVNMPIGQNVSEVKSREVYYTGAPYFDKMTECYLNGKCIFTEADFRAPALTELREIEASDKAADGALYDLSGRRVDHPRRGQIYVSNGRKLRF